MPSLGSTRGGPMKAQNQDSDLYVVDSKPISTEDMVKMSEMHELLQKYLESNTFKFNVLQNFQEWLMDRHDKGLL